MITNCIMNKQWIEHENGLNWEVEESTNRYMNRLYNMREREREILRVTFERFVVGEDLMCFSFLFILSLFLSLPRSLSFRVISCHASLSIYQSFSLLLNHCLSLPPSSFLSLLHHENAIITVVDCSMTLFPPSVFLFYLSFLFFLSVSSLSLSVSALNILPCGNFSLLSFSLTLTLYLLLKKRTISINLCFFWPFSESLNIFTCLNIFYLTPPFRFILLHSVIL